MTVAPIHPEVEQLECLLGTWSGAGVGDYPTIEPFRYEETVTFSHVGKPFVIYNQRTASPDGRPLHCEAGYLRIPRSGRAELVVCHPTGIVEVDEGTFDGRTLRLASRSLGSTATAKEVTAIERDVDVTGDLVTYALRMAAVGRPLLHHLSGELRRTS